ncbi:MAG: BamA/TamA family outer membrane protein [Bacteroidia bacterium]|nr:BamA/TamA family outer membrane protein [Bacteroidia bacterium]
MNRLSLFFVLFISYISLVGQQKYGLLFTSRYHETCLRRDYNQSFSDTVTRNQEIGDFISKLHSEGYLTARADSLYDQGNLRTVILHCGTRFEWADIQPDEESRAFLALAGIREKDIPHGAFQIQTLSRFMERILKYGEENGYPFIVTRLDSVKILPQKISAKLVTVKGPLILIDSLIIKGNARVSNAFIQSHLGIRPGDPYNEKNIRNISVKLKEIPFLKADGSPEVLFLNEKATVRLILNKKRASQFDGILGFQPDSKTGKAIFTGDVRLKILNAFSRGESHEFNWRQLQVQTQDMKAHFFYPYLFQSPFCLDLRFRLYKKDTSWIEVNPIAGIEFKLSGKRSVRGFVDRRTLNLLSTSAYQQISTLPPAADMQSTLYGLSLKLEDLDYRYNPRSGYQIVATGKAGIKKIIPNAGIGDAAYLNTDLQTSSYVLEGEARWFLPLFRRSALMTGVRGSGLVSENIFQNELVRIGGTHTVRGFDEESIPCSAYGAATLEYRYLLEQNSYLHFFGESAWYENYSLTASREGFLLSYGAGISFETRAGIFSLSYALGSELPAGPDLRNGKIHFGIAGLF